MATLSPESPFKPGRVPVDQLQGQFGWDLPYGGHAPPPTPEPRPHHSAGGSTLTEPGVRRTAPRPAGPATGPPREPTAPSRPPTGPPRVGFWRSTTLPWIVLGVALALLVPFYGSLALGTLLGAGPGWSYSEDFSTADTAFGVWDDETGSGQVVDGRFVLTASRTWASWADLADPMTEVSVQVAVAPSAGAQAGPLIQGELVGYGATIEQDGTLSLWNGEVLLGRTETEPLTPGEPVPVTLDAWLSDDGRILYLEASRKAMIASQAWAYGPGGSVTAEVEPITVEVFGMFVMTDGARVQGVFDDFLAYEQRSPGTG